MGEDRIIEEVLAWDPWGPVVELCSELIRIPSENPPGDCREIAGFIAAYLERAGIPVRRMEGPSGQPSLISELEFGEEPVLILNGHMDVVPAGDPSHWSWDPYGGAVEEEYVLGRGASDMKGGLAALLVAFVHMARTAPPDLQGKLVLMAVPDEETGGRNGTGFLLEQGLCGDACLIAEPSGIDPTIGQKGSIWLRLRAEGKPAHGSLSPLVGRNAIREICKGIEVLYGLWEEKWPIPPRERELIARTQTILRSRGLASPAETLGRVTVNVGRISGGEKVNMVADSCEAHFDLRVPIGLETSRVLRAAAERLERAGLGGARLEPLVSPNESNYTPPEEPFVGLVLESIAAVTGEKPRPLLQWASSDARFFRYRGIPTVQFGPCELEGIHGYNERVRMDDLVQSARVYALVMRRFLGEKPS